jgi:hypothetical protein
MNTQSAAQKGHDAKETGAEIVARVGYSARGVVYLLIGGLSLWAAIGTGGKTTGSRGALTSLQDEPFGQAILLAIAAGLWAYSVWRLIQSIEDRDDHGKDFTGIVIRSSLILSALSHTLLGFFAASLVFNWRPGGSSGGSSGGESSAQSWSGWLMSKPGGEWILGAIGLGVIGIGIAQGYKAFKEKYKEHFKAEAKGKGWVDAASKVGLYSRALVFAVIGGMLISAAWQSDKFEAGGLGKGLRTLQQQPYGWILLGVVSLGLICFAIFSFIEARYRKV